MFYVERRWFLKIETLTEKIIRARRRGSSLVRETVM
jgi:hypothetical protein